MTSQSVVVVVGDVINDIIVRPRRPLEVGTDTPSHIERSAGGSGANQAAWIGAQQVLVRFAGRVGAPDAANHSEALQQLGVETWLGVDLELATGTIVVLVSADGERSMFTDRGANRRLAATDVPTRLLDNAGLLHVSAYPLFEPSTRSAVLQLWAAALDAGVPTSVDPASLAGLRDVGRDPFFEWTSGARIVFPNLDEGVFLTGCGDPEAIVAALLRVYPVVALKLGAAGTLVGAADGVRVAVSARSVAVVDSTGAGDAFCAGFIAAWHRGSNLTECAHGAVATAARAIGQVGGRPRAI